MAYPGQPYGSSRQYGASHQSGQPPYSQPRSSQSPSQDSPVHQIPLPYASPASSQSWSNPDLAYIQESYPRPPPSVPAVERPYHAKRPHKKSRAGCHNCKARKVKCDEAQPRCRACTQRNEDCVYPNLYLPFVAASSSAPAPPQPSRSGAAANTGRVRMPLDIQTTARASSSHPSSNESRPLQQYMPPIRLPQGFVYEESDENSYQEAHRRAGWQEYTSSRRYGYPVLKEPLFRPKQFDEKDMEVMWFYSAKGFRAFSSSFNRRPSVEKALQVTIPQYGFAHSYLMDCILALSALEFHSLNQPIESQRVLRYRARAFNGYRRAIESATPDEYPALLACSLLLVALSSGQFRDPGCKPLYILDWMVVWRGIGLMIKLMDPVMMQKSGLAILFARPPINMDSSARFVPNNLLHLLGPISEGDPDYVYIDAYIGTLKLLGSLYRDIHAGISLILFLRIVVWFTFVPTGFVEAVRKRRPLALIIIGHYLVFVKLCNYIWWLRGISDKEILDIKDILGDEYMPYYTAPLAAIGVDGLEDLRELLLRPEDWTRNNYYNAVLDSLVQDRAFASGSEKVVYTSAWMDEDLGKASSSWRNEDYHNLSKLRFNKDEISDMEMPIDKGSPESASNNSRTKVQGQPQPQPESHTESQHSQAPTR